MRLKDLREDHDLKQSDVAKILNISQVSYGRYELGISEPTIESLIKLADFYNVSLDYLLGLSEDKKVKNSDENYDLDIAMSIGKLYSLDENSHLSKSQIELIKKLLLANKDFILSA